VSRAAHHVAVRHEFASTDPPATDPPTTDPPTTDPPVTDPPVTDPPWVRRPVSAPVTCIRSNTSSASSLALSVRTLYRRVTLRLEGRSVSGDQSAARRGFFPRRARRLSAPVTAVSRATRVRRLSAPTRRRPPGGSTLRRVRPFATVPVATRARPSRRERFRPRDQRPPRRPDVVDVSDLGRSIADAVRRRIDSA
jgi:hypothetical protein